MVATLNFLRQLTARHSIVDLSEWLSAMCEPYKDKAMALEHWKQSRKTIPFRR